MLDKLWDDTVAGPQPERGLEKLRKLTTSIIKDEGGSAQLMRNTSLPSTPTTPATPTTPQSARKVDNVWRSVFNPGSNSATKTIGAHMFDKPLPNTPTVYDWIMVGLPSAENRETILKTLLAKGKHEDIDFKELSTMTEGYSGSDLKNLCTTAAYRPIKELMQQEKEKEMKKKKKEAEVEKSEDVSNAGDEEKNDQVIALRPLNMEDMRQAKEKVAASYATEGSNMKMLEQWNNLYGEGGSRKKEEQLSYFI